MLSGPFFTGASPATLEALQRTGARQALPAGATLFHEGDPARSFIVIVEGRVRIWRSAADGTTMTVHMLGAGDVPGCVAVFRGIPYPATATAVDTAAVIRWPLAHVTELLRRDAALAANALAIVGHRNGEMLERLLEVSTQSVEQRLARALLRLADAEPGSERPELHITRQELAELTATTLHTVSRFIGRWQGRGIVAGGRGRIRVQDRAALAALAED